MQLTLFTKQKSKDWKWSFKDYPKTNGLKVFSCFACGGGSTMGYKLSGCEVIGCCEIDKRMNDVYIENHKPKYNYLEDIRDFNKRKDLPEELYNLDILDGSPPCSTFSTAGQRKDSWGKEKKFREGQKLQTLDDLLFVFIDTIKKLNPKVAILENVEGLMLGEAWKYVQEIYSRLNKIGYSVKHWLVKGENMGVPQNRHRIFFIATRLDFDLNKIDLGFDYEPIPFKDIKEGKGRKPGKKAKMLLEAAKPGDTLLSQAYQRLYGKKSWFTHALCNDDYVMPTILAGHDCMWRLTEKEGCSKLDFIHGGTFPEDYNFLKEGVSYIVGMSVPPVMIKRIMERLLKSGIFERRIYE